MRLRVAVSIVLATAGILAVSQPATPAERSSSRPLATCFWEGPISMKRPTTRGYDGRYFGFPDESATYWLARFSLPAGARLFLRGRYPHTRYMSINAYSETAPTDALSDFEIEPRPGSTNPFVAGNRRDLPDRSYRVRVLDQPPPPESQRAPNTLYAQPDGNVPIELLYRTYEPDRGRDFTGDAGLPRPRVKLGDGTLLRGGHACEEVNHPSRGISVPKTTPEQWEIAKNAPGCDSAVAPAENPPRWDRFFNLDYARIGFALGCTDAARAVHRELPHEETGALYSNADIRYVFTMLSRKFGPVLVVEAKLPTFPRTYDGARRMRSGQVRFWSLCSTESAVTLFTSSCLADRQVPLGPGRRFLVAVSKGADRPANARRPCGVAWLRWAERGDGAGRPDFGQLIIRNMLPSPDFAEAIQNIRKLGTERAVMGPYFPRSTHTTTEEFEDRGCPA